MVVGREVIEVFQDVVHILEDVFVVPLMHARWY